MSPSQVIDRQTEAPYDAVVRFLSQPTTYAEHPSRVDLRETHISCVFLTDRHAYKLKKPLRFEFVDFSTPAARRRACEDEVRLNRRMAKDVYVGVVPVTRGPGKSLRLGGSGPVVDWLVKMRRLPEDRMLDQLIESGRLRQTDIDRLAAMLVRFYREAPPLVLLPERYRTEIERHVRANRTELLEARYGLPAPLVRRVHAAQLLFLRSSAALLDARVCDGRIIDGHGDLRPEHVCLDHAPAVFDCLEFSSELRQLDVWDELCFFAMECELLGADFVGRRVLDLYSQHAGDRPPERLTDFYKCYRACVRAKVAALRSRQLPEVARGEALAQAKAYLELAQGYAGRLMSPVVLVVRGLMGSGKTTLAALLAEMLGLERLGTDDIRRELFGPSPKPVVYNEGNYTPEARGRVYDTLFARSQRLLAEGESAVLDGTFLSTDLLRRAQTLAKAHDFRLLTITCHCPAEVAGDRIANRASRRDSTSEARPEHLTRQQVELDAVPKDICAIDVDTSQLSPDVLQQVLNCLTALREAPPQRRI